MWKWKQQEQTCFFFDFFTQCSLCLNFSFSHFELSSFFSKPLRMLLCCDCSFAGEVCRRFVTWYALNSPRPSCCRIHCSRSSARCWRLTSGTMVTVLVSRTTVNPCSRGTRFSARSSIFDEQSLKFFLRSRGVCELTTARRDSLIVEQWVSTRPGCASGNFFTNWPPLIRACDAATRFDSSIRLLFARVMPFGGMVEKFSRAQQLLKTFLLKTLFILWFIVHYDVTFSVWEGPSRNGNWLFVGVLNSPEWAGFSGMLQIFITHREPFIQNWNPGLPVDLCEVEHSILKLSSSWIQGCFENEKATITGHVHNSWIFEKPL